MTSKVESEVIVLDSEDEDPARDTPSPAPSQRSLNSGIEIDEDTIPMPPTPQPAHQRVASELASDVQTLLPCTSDEDDDVIDITEAIDTIDLDEYDTDQENEKDDDIVKEENGKDDSESEKDSEEDDDEVEEENKEYERNETTTPNSQPQSEFSTSRSSFHSSAGSFILTPPLTPSPNIYDAKISEMKFQESGMNLEARRALSTQPAAMGVIPSPERNEDTNDGESGTPFFHMSATLKLTPRRSTKETAWDHQSLSTTSTNHNSSIPTLSSTRTVEQDPREGPSYLWDYESDDSRSTLILSPKGSQLEDAYTLQKSELASAPLAEEISQSESIFYYDNISIDSTQASRRQEFPLPTTSTSSLIKNFSQTHLTHCPSSTNIPSVDTNISPMSSEKVSRMPQSSFSPTSPIQNDILSLPKLPAYKYIFDCPDIYEVYNKCDPSTRKIWETISLQQKKIKILYDLLIKLKTDITNTTLNVANAENNRTNQSHVVGLNKFDTEQKQLAPKNRQTVIDLPLTNLENNNSKTSQQDFDKSNGKQSCFVANPNESMSDNYFTNDDSLRCKKRKYDDYPSEMNAGSEQNNPNISITTSVDNVIDQKRPKKSSKIGKKDKTIKINATDSTSNLIVDRKHLDINPLPSSSNQYHEISKNKTPPPTKPDFDKILPLPNDCKEQFKVILQKKRRSNSSRELHQNRDEPKNKKLKAASSSNHSFPPKPEQPLDPDLMASTIASLNGNPPVSDVSCCSNTYEPEYAHRSYMINGVRIPSTALSQVPVRIELPNEVLPAMQMRKKVHSNNFDYNNAPRLSTPPTEHF